MQTASFKVWTRFTVTISYDENCCNTSASTYYAYIRYINQEHNGSKNIIKFLGQTK